MYYPRRGKSVLPQTQNESVQMTTESSASRIKVLGRRKTMKFLAAVVLMNCLYSSFTDPTQRRTEAEFNQMDSSVPLELLQAIQANNNSKQGKTTLASSDGRDLLQEEKDTDQRSSDGDLDSRGEDSAKNFDEMDDESSSREMRASKDEFEATDEDTDDEDTEDEEGTEKDDDEGGENTNEEDEEEQYEDDPDEKDPEDEKKDGEEEVHGIMSKLFKSKSSEGDEGGNEDEFATFMEEKDQEPIYDITKLTASDASDPRDLTFLSEPINDQVNVGESLRSLNFAYPDDEPSRKDELRNLNFDYPDDESSEEQELDSRETGDGMEREEMRGGEEFGDGMSRGGGSDGDDYDSPYHLKNLNLDPESLKNMDAETLNKIMEVNNINPDVLPKFSDDNQQEQMRGSDNDSGGRQFDEDKFQGGMRGSDNDNGDRQFNENNFQGDMRSNDGDRQFNDNFQGDMRSNDGDRQFNDNFQGDMRSNDGDRQFNDNFQGDMRSNDGDRQFNDNFQGDMRSNDGDRQFNDNFQGDMRSNDGGPGETLLDDARSFNDNSSQGEMRSNDGSPGENLLDNMIGRMRTNDASESDGQSLDDCKTPWIPAPKQEPVTPTMNASYPGSGARLSWKLIRAITGHMTSDDAVDDGEIARRGLAISIKTHYPAHGSNDELFKPFANVERSVLLVRNPANAIPSFLSYLYERNNGLENHSTRAPLDYWIEWRDNNFDAELQSWVEHTLFWLEHNRKENLLVVSYERLINAETGPDELKNIGDFIAQTSGIRLPQKTEDIPCVWDYVVNSRGDKQPQSHRSGGPKRWPYTDRQIDMLVSYLTSLGKMYPEMAYIMDDYIVDTLAIQAYTRNMTP